jgi:hypothetical protein
MKPKIPRPKSRVTIKVRLPLASGREYMKNPYGDITFRNLSVHTRIYDICNKLCDKMNVDLFTTNV